MDWKRYWGGVPLWLSIIFYTNSAAVHIKEGGEKIVTAGHTFRLTCEGSGHLIWNYPIDVQHRTSTRTSKKQSILEVYSPTTNDTGYYKCIDESSTSTATIYVYVYDEENLLVFSSNTYLTARIGDDIIIPCRTTHPDVKVILTQNMQPIENTGSYNPREGFLFKNVSISHHGTLFCVATYEEKEDSAFYFLMVPVSDPLPKPSIMGTNLQHVIEGEDIHLSCSVITSPLRIHSLKWLSPDKKVINITRRTNIQRIHNAPLRGQSSKTDTINLTISSVQKSDAGNYSCVIEGDNQSIKDIIQLIVFEKDEGFINFHMDGGTTLIEVNDNTPSVKWAVGYEGAPSPTFQWYAPDGNKIKDNPKYKVTKNPTQIVLIISSITPSDAGVYVLVGKAGNKEKKQNLTLLVKALPEISIIGGYDLFKYHKIYDIQCRVNSYPSSNVSWSFINCTDYIHCDKKETIILQEKLPNYNFTSYISLKSYTSGKLKCEACNLIGCTSAFLNYFIGDYEDGLHLSHPKSPVEGENITLLCSASIYNFTNDLTWWRKLNNSDKFEPIIFKEGLYSNESRSLLSFESTLHLKNISYNGSNGQYLCKAKRLHSTKSFADSNIINLVIKGRKRPFFIRKQEDSYTYFAGDGASLDCTVNGFPEPIVQWLKNGKDMNLHSNSSRIQFHNRKQTLVIIRTELEDTGIYQCKVHNKAGTTERTFNVTVIKMSHQSQTSSKGTYAAIAVIFLILLIAVIYLIWRIKKERKHVQALTAQEVTAFHEGALLTVDPDLGIDEQADLLPYNKDFEFPKEKLKLGKQIGSGAFGRVVKAEAEGIKEEEKVTTVAVKMIKPQADISHLKALMTELKILIYIGHHINVLNLLGACTINLIHKELYVILEYCRYGNLNSYLQRHRESFINQINPITDVIDFNIGNDTAVDSAKDEVSMNPSGEVNKDLTVIYNNSSGQMQYMDTTGENSMSIMNDSTGCSNTGELRWNITYKADFKGKLASPLNTKDLLCWSYQVAQGMEYLSSLKIVHADLAARNILLADNNIVKICDFGLARNLYKNLDYKKKGQDPLPVKWMAIESIEDRIFSTKSDVWSFGVVLWELFTLAKTPYPGIEVNEEFLQQLLKGYRMSKPEYSTHDMYRVMLGCWKAKPSDRPSFADLVHRIGETLDYEFKEHYLELSTPYVNQNVVKNNDYINLSNGDDSEYIPPGNSSHTYVNLKVIADEEYINMDRKSEELKYQPQSDGSEYLSMTK